MIRARRRPAPGTVLLLTLLISAAAHSAAAGQEADPTGRWRGEIATPTPLGVRVELTREGDAWTGTIDIPMQNASGLELDPVLVAGDSAVFSIAGVPGEPTFHGILSASGDSLSGTFTQGEGSFDFALTRSTGAEAREALEGLGEWLDRQMASWRVPGLALAVVKDDEVVHLEGYGLRSVEDSLPVTPRTLFAIGSSTKAFTTALLGTLVDEGALDLDDRVQEHLPELVLADTALGTRLTIRDMITHRSGLPRHDVLWYANPDLTRPEMVERLAYLPPTADLRSAWQYNNLMFMTAGYLAGRVAGTSWEEAVRARLFEPLSMERSNFSVAASQADPDHALPYGERDDSVLGLSFRTIDAVGPAGSINSTAEEMASWVRMHLAEGAIDGTTVLEQATVEAMQTPWMVINARPSDPDLGLQTYGLGWFVDAYRGHYRVHHGGNIDGFSALVSLFPHDELGIVVLTNKNGTGLPELTVRQVADRVFGLEPRDWSAEALERRDAARAQADSIAEAGGEDEVVEGTTPSHPLEAYVGTYRHPGYGDLEVTLEDGGLKLAYYREAFDLEHVHYDVFETKDPAELSPFSGQRIRFLVGMDGAVESMEMPLESQLPPFRFQRAPDERLTDPAFLDRLAGRYGFQGQVITVSRRGDGVVVTIPGQPTYTLVPDRETSFTLEAAPGIRVSFEVPDEGPAAAVTFHQPNGTFRYERVEGAAAPAP